MIERFGRLTDEDRLVCFELNYIILQQLQPPPGRFMWNLWLWFFHDTD